jgi:hypothetical protein
MGRMSFAEIVAAADEDKRRHHERQAAITRAHFERHPECRKAIVGMDEAGNVKRGTAEIDVEARCQPGWFKTSMWKSGPPDVNRPVENRRSSVELWWWLDERGSVKLTRYMQTNYLPAVQQAARPARRPAVPVVAEWHTMKVQV